MAGKAKDTFQGEDYVPAESGGLKIFQNDPEGTWDATAEQFSVGADESADAFYDKALSSGFYQNYLRQKEYDKQNAIGPLLDPQELNQKFADRGVIFKEPTSLDAAEDQVRWKEYQDSLNEKIGLGPDGASIWTRKNLWATVKAGAQDPVGVGLGFGAAKVAGAIVGRVLGPTASQLAASAGLGAEEIAAAAASQTIGSTAGRIAAHMGAAGVVGAIPATGIEAYQAGIDQRDFGIDDYADSFINNVAANVMFDAAFLGVGAAVKFGTKRGWGYMSGSDFAKREAFDTAVNQAYAGKRPDPSIISDLVRREREGFWSGGPDDPNGPPGGGDYSGRYGTRAITDPNGRTSGTVYHGSKGRVIEIPRGEYEVFPFEDNTGSGLYLTDDAVTANNFAASKFNSTTGNVLQFELKDANLLNINHPLESRLASIKNILLDAISDPEAKAYITKELQTGNTLKEIFNEIHSSMQPETASAVIMAVNQSIEAEGFDGYLLKDGNSKEMMIFDGAQGKLEKRGAFESDPSSTPDSESIDQSIGDAYRAKMNSPESNISYIKEVDEAARAFSERALVEVPIVDQTEVDLQAKLDILNEQVNYGKELEISNSANGLLTAKNGKKFIIEIPRRGQFEAFDTSGKKIGYLHSSIDKETGKAFVESVLVGGGFTDGGSAGRQGVGTELYKAFYRENNGNVTLSPDNVVSDSAWALWKKNFPEQASEFVNRMASKYVNAGKSRPPQHGEKYDAIDTDIESAMKEPLDFGENPDGLLEAAGPSTNGSVRSAKINEAAIKNAIPCVGSS